MCEMWSDSLLAKLSRVLLLFCLVGTLDKSSGDTNVIIAGLLKTNIVSQAGSSFPPISQLAKQTTQSACVSKHLVSR